MQLVELHFADSATFDGGTVIEMTSRILNTEVTTLASFAEFGTLLVVYPNATAPVQASVSLRPTPVSDSYDLQLSQSWRCDSASSLIRSSNFFITVKEVLGQTVPSSERLALFHGLLSALILTTNPLALVFQHTTQIVDPADYMEKFSKAPIFRPGTLNVRKVANGNGITMDIIGLEAIGLYDVQCQFENLDAREVQNLLLNLVGYILENGPIIKQDQTIPGLSPGEKWRCEFVESVIQPIRTVLSVLPKSN